MADPLTPEEEQAAYEEFLAQFARDGIALPAVKPEVEDPRLRTFWDGNTEKLSEDEARDVLMERLGMRNVSGKQLWLPDYVLKSIPQKAWTADLLNNLDLRPYMQNVVDYYDQGGKFYEGSGSTNDLNNERLKERAQRVLDEQTTIGEDAVKSALKDDNATPPPFESTTAGLSVSAQVAGWATDLQIAAQEGRPGNSFKDWASGGDSLDAPKVSEQEIRDALSLSGSTDVLDVLNVTGNYQEQGRPSDPQYVQVGDPLGPSTAMDPGGGAVPNKLSITAAAKYLQSPNVTPSMVKNMQDQLVRAGYMDGINARIVPGDGWDQATNVAWRRALADSYQRGIPLPQLLKQQEQERSAGFKPISSVGQRAMLDQVAQSVLGRRLDAQEQAQLIQQLYTLRDKPLSGPNADGSGGTMGEGLWYSEEDVASKLLDAHGGELGGAAAADSMYAMNRMVEGLFK